VESRPKGACLPCGRFPTRTRDPPNSIRGCKFTRCPLASVQRRVGKGLPAYALVRPLLMLSLISQGRSVAAASGLAAVSRVGSGRPDRQQGAVQLAHCCRVSGKTCVDGRVGVFVIGMRCQVAVCANTSSRRVRALPRLVRRSTLGRQLPRCRSFAERGWALSATNIAVPHVL